MENKSGNTFSVSVILNKMQLIKIGIQLFALMFKIIKFSQSFTKNNKIFWGFYQEVFTKSELCPKLCLLRHFFGCGSSPNIIVVSE